MLKLVEVIADLLNATSTHFTGWLPERVPAGLKHFQGLSLEELLGELAKGIVLHIELLQVCQLQDRLWEGPEQVVGDVEVLEAALTSCQVPGEGTETVVVQPQVFKPGETGENSLRDGPDLVLIQLKPLQTDQALDFIGKVHKLILGQYQLLEVAKLRYASDGPELVPVKVKALQHGIAQDFRREHTEPLGREIHFVQSVLLLLTWTYRTGKVVKRDFGSLELQTFFFFLCMSLGNFGPQRKAEMLVEQCNHNHCLNSSCVLSREELKPRILAGTEDGRTVPTRC